MPEDFGNGIPLDLTQLEVPSVAIVHLATQPPGSLQQVTLRPDKVSKAGFIRLGETPGDEALCWIHPQNVFVMEMLGQAVAPDSTDGATDGKPWMCVPFKPKSTEAEEVEAALEIAA